MPTPVTMTTYAVRLIAARMITTDDNIVADIAGECRLFTTSPRCRPPIFNIRRCPFATTEDAADTRLFDNRREDVYDMSARGAIRDARARERRTSSNIR